ncbi:hypothetical protein, partial [Anaerostipes caccae]|uniref:hypothetical protein n=1 Tax=Anaerostipes caccae TaxID=105841 RepID=UPI0039C439F6
LRPLDPKSSALAKLSHTPICNSFLKDFPKLLLFGCRLSHKQDLLYWTGAQKSTSFLYFFKTGLNRITARFVSRFAAGFYILS